MNEASPQQEQRWLLLIHQLPAKPAYFRVKIWRRLQGLGAIAVKSTVYALPANSETQEDFEWLLKEIIEGGGEAMVCEARLIDGLSDAQVRALFDAARDEDYAVIAKECRVLAAMLETDSSPEKQIEVRVQLGRLRKRLTDIERIDFFGADGREPAEGLLRGLELRITKEQAMIGPSPLNPSQPRLEGTAANLKGRIWITRQDVHVDRIACAWLIRRFIDPEAEIRFVSGKDYRPKPGELRFDMFDGEFTHEGDRCSFEVLLARAGLSDSALQEIAEIIHDIDLKDGKFGRAEASGIAHVVAGIAMANQDDRQRIAQGMPVLDNLYQYFRRKHG